MKATVTQMDTGPSGADPRGLKKVLPMTLQRNRESLRDIVSFLLEIVSLGTRRGTKAKIIQRNIRIGVLRWLCSSCPGTAHMQVIDP